MAPVAIVVAVDPIIPPALRPPSARVEVVVVAQTRGTLPGVIRMIDQDRRGIAVLTPPTTRQGHRVMHRDGVDSYVRFHVHEDTSLSAIF